MTPIVFGELTHVAKADSARNLADAGRRRVAPGDIIWGVGPTVNMPTNTENSLGNDKWSGGPAFVALTMRAAWVTGLLAQQFWDFAGDDDAADVDVTTLQYFVNYNTPDFYLNTSPTMVYD